jgi:hypothetical protein
MAVLWFTEMNLHIAVVRSAARCDPRAPHELRSTLDRRAGSPLPENLPCGSGPRAAGFEALLH